MFYSSKFYTVKFSKSGQYISIYFTTYMAPMKSYNSVNSKQWHSPNIFGYMSVDSYRDMI